MQHWLVKEYAKLVGNHLQIWSGSFTGRGGGGSWPSEATASGFEKKTGPYDVHFYYKKVAPRPREMWQEGILDMHTPESQRWLLQKELGEMYEASSDEDH